MNDLMTIKGVRGYVDENGTALLNLEDISRGLGFTQEKGGVAYIRWERVNQYLMELRFPTGGEFVPENIFYRLAMKASNETAEHFQTIVADEILPSIRKHGVYATDNALEAMLSDPDTMIRTLTALKQERAQRIAAEATVRLQAPKVLFADSVAGSSGGILVRDMAKILCQNGFDIGEKRFYSWLRERAYVIKNEGSDKNMPTQKSMELGVMDIREGTRINPEGVVKPLKTTLVTGKGQIYFINKFKELAQKGA